MYVRFLLMTPKCMGKPALCDFSKLANTRTNIVWFSYKNTTSRT